MTDPPDLLALPWRVGRESARTVFAVADDPDGALTWPMQPGDADVLIGVMDTPDLAREAVEAHAVALAAARLAAPAA